MRCLFYCGRIYSIKFKLSHKFQFCLKFLKKKKKKKSNKCVNNNIKLPCTNFTKVIFLSKKVARSQLVDDRLTRKKIFSWPAANQSKRNENTETFQQSLNTENNFDHSLLKFLEKVALILFLRNTTKYKILQTS